MAVLFGIITLCLLGAAGWYVFPTASNVGYAPEQPIPFSHRLHAGVNHIDCRYCHVGATESRHATVPALNVCMNCHRAVKTDSPWIQMVQKHYKEGTPIEWVRVHRLPDHVKFNHKAHLARGLDCKTCHGDVRQMDRIQQVGALTMGWCLQCHRGMNVPSSVLAVAKPGADPEHPGQMAPFQCSTCHY